jgi:hypothetical protein
LSNHTCSRLQRSTNTCAPWVRIASSENCSENHSSSHHGKAHPREPQYSHQSDDLAKYIFLSTLHDRNEVLYYRVLRDHLAEMLRFVYTPTVGAAIERYSQEFQRPRGVYLCIDDPDGIDVAFQNFGAASPSWAA